jgi:hypothetical protein
MDEQQENGTSNGATPGANGRQKTTPAPPPAIIKNHRFTLPTMGKPLTHVRRLVLKLRATLEEVVIEAHGSVNMYHASVIATACVALREFWRLDRILNKSGNPKAASEDKLTPEQICSFSDRCVRHKSKIDDCLAKLGLDRDAKKNLWDTIYLQPASQATKVPPAASG